MTGVGYETVAASSGDGPLLSAGALPETVVRELEELDLTTNEARALLVLLRLGKVNSAELARHSGVPRTSTYQIMEELTAKGLAQRLSVDGPATWGSPGRDEVVRRLTALQEDRHREHMARAEQLGDMLVDLFPEAGSVAVPYVHQIHEAAKVAATYDRLLDDAEREILVFNRPPYSAGAGYVNPRVIAALTRGVSTRVLYQAEQWEEPVAAEFRRAMAVYHDAGVEGRLVDELPIKLALVDRRVALLALLDPVAAEIGFPTNLLIEHPGFASIQAEAFERLWDAGRPCAPLAADLPEFGAPAAEPKPAEERRSMGSHMPRAQAAEG